MLFVVVGVLCAGAAGFALYRQADPAAVQRAHGGPKGVASTDGGAQGSAGPRKVSLYCQFYVFVESRPFVAFLLEQAPEDPGLYRQVYVAKADGDRTDYNVLAGRRPEWRFDGTTDLARLDARVTVPEHSQIGLGEEEIAIELRGFDPADASGAWREASLRSVYYQNLPGKCRRTAGSDRPEDPDQRSEGGAPAPSRAATILPTDSSRSLTASASDFVRI